MDHNDLRDYDRRRARYHGKAPKTAGQVIAEIECARLGIDPSAPFDAVAYEQAKERSK